MSHTGIFATKAEIDTKVGKSVVAAGYTEAAINYACAHAESFINTACKYNFSDAYATLNADVKGILSELEACFVAIDFIAYDMSGYTSRVEAEDMINIQWAKFKLLIAELKEQDKVSFIRGA